MPKVVGLLSPDPGDERLEMPASPSADRTGRRPAPWLSSAHPNGSSRAARVRRRVLWGSGSSTRRRSDTSTVPREARPPVRSWSRAARRFDGMPRSAPRSLPSVASDSSNSRSPRRRRRPRDSAPGYRGEPSDAATDTRGRTIGSCPLKVTRTRPVRHRHRSVVRPRRGHEPDAHTRRCPRRLRATRCGVDASLRGEERDLERMLRNGINSLRGPSRWYPSASPPLATLTAALGSRRSSTSGSRERRTR